MNSFLGFLMDSEDPPPRLGLDQNRVAELQFHTSCMLCLREGDREKVSGIWTWVRVTGLVSPCMGDGAGLLKKQQRNNAIKEDVASAVDIGGTG